MIHSLSEREMIFLMTRKSDYLRLDPSRLENEWMLITGVACALLVISFEVPLSGTMSHLETTREDRQTPTQSWKLAVLVAVVLFDLESSFPAR